MTRRREDPAETAEWEAAKGHHAEIPLPAPPPPAPNTQAPRWFLPVLGAFTAVALVAGLLLARAERAERDARVSDLTSEFTTEACTP